MKHRSTTNTYRLSNGDRITSASLERKITEAKKEKVETFQFEEGYIYCEECKINNSFKFDVSHTVSVDEAKKSGRSELCYDQENLRILCRPCHIEHDKL